MLIDKIKAEIEDDNVLITNLNLLQHEIPSELFFCSFKEGDSFGEKAFIKNTTRAGTCIAGTTCFLVAVEKELYMKTVKKLHMEQL